ncbi:MAG: HAMP domain-containing sensor histidine kinase [Schleiferiaceae bacterium]|nr:HAMP domain-containing sensor histidine kinase [Schleiferiaceae bacterium]
MHWPTITLRTRIFLAMLLLVLVGFGATGIVSGLHFRAEEVEYHRDRLQRKEHAIEAHLTHELNRESEMPLSTNSLPELLSSELCSIADIHGMDVALYSMDGVLLLSSNPVLNDDGTFPMRLPEGIRSQRNEVLTIHPSSDTIREVMIYSSEIVNPEGLPLAIMVVPYTDGRSLPVEDEAFFRALAYLNIVLFLAAAYFAYLLSRSITRGLDAIGDAMRSTRSTSDRKWVKWASNDEIGALITEYNRMVDMTEEHARALALAEKESAWKEMAQQVAHEIKNPLTPMRLMTQLHAMNADQQSAESIKEFSEGMLAQIDAMAQIAGDFSQFTRMPARDRVQVDLRNLLKEAHAAYPKASLLLPREGEWTVLANEEQLLRVINNLLNNAFESLESGRKALVSFGLRREENQAHIFVRDNGSGIPKDRMEQIFEPKFTTKSRGTGLGLAIVKTIVESFQGRIWVEESSTAGTEFVFSLPLKEQD